MKQAIHEITHHTLCPYCEALDTLGPRGPGGWMCTFCNEVSTN